MVERAERLQRQFFQPGRAAAPGPICGPTWQPPVDLYETEDEYWIVVALPGVRPEQVELQLRDDVLTVAGERALPVASRAAIIHRLEIPHGRFERAVRLPSGRLEMGRRELVDGCLIVTLRKPVG